MTDIQRNAPIEESLLVDLIQRAQEWGDPRAFDGIYLLYADRIYRYLLARIGDPVLSEEVTSQVFLHLIRKIGRYRLAPQDNVAIFSAWFYRLAYNKMIDIQRKQKRTRAMPIEFAEQSPGKHHVADEVLEKMEIEEVLQRMQSLNDSQKNVILLRFIEGHNIAETAQIMEKSEGAIKALQHRALENLRNLLLP
ncbi:MAG: sigma-70 family RNA polymerase sigma factor [Caldilineaceae bacterium]|nr:sigma-70 family RNA polymerase sigma factor [Caldilineaceae bacterium]